MGYKRLMEVHPIPQHQAFSWFYLGATLIVLGWLLFGNKSMMPTTTLSGALLWLGIAASVRLFMWNHEPKWMLEPLLL
ncbi:hypothetical protein J4727_18655 [Providencia rettgeri]|uniref:Uncharacterized protein n=1 Tax=Providencia rettgeri TaxID=587 RepID=A0A939NFF9_PRORE|nr:hypothetical protein [Providencia rettgeri]